MYMNNQFEPKSKETQTEVVNPIEGLNDEEKSRLKLGLEKIFGSKDFKVDPNATFSGLQDLIDAFDAIHALMMSVSGIDPGSIKLAHTLNCLKIDEDLRRFKDK